MKEYRTIPMPRVCPDCFHDECSELFAAWKLLDAAERKDAGMP